MEANDTILEAEKAQEHYDKLYSEGYMCGADASKLEKLNDFFTGFQLPEYGVALDFGCGSGAYTEFLKKRLPKWQIYGADISKTALELARKGLPDVIFEEIDSIKDEHEKFDLIFSHHVLEHVQDIEETFAIFSRIMKKKSYLVHILPCGNEGSLEHTICMMRQDGIDHTRGNRFFYEDPTHMRRLTSDNLTSLAERIDFYPHHERYNNHYFSALDWLSISVKDLRKELLDLSKIPRPKDKCRAVKYRLFIDILDYTRSIVTRCESPRASLRGKLFRLGLRITLYPFAHPVQAWIARRITQEWQEGTVHKNGSEMFMAYERG